jgi:hypothetical protein
MIIGKIFAGWMADRFGRRAIFAFGAFGAAIFLPVIVLFHTPENIVYLMTIFGFLYGVPYGVNATYMTESFAKISVIFTAAFVSNQRSIQMLKKVGFEKMPISAYAPHDNRTFFILTTDPTIKKNGNSELINFYQREDHPHRFYTSDSV